MLVSILLQAYRQLLLGHHRSDRFTPFNTCRGLLSTSVQCTVRAYLVLLHTPQGRLRQQLAGDAAVVVQAAAKFEQGTQSLTRLAEQEADSRMVHGISQSQLQCLATGIVATECLCCVVLGCVNARPWQGHKRFRGLAAKGVSSAASTSIRVTAVFHAHLVTWVDGDCLCQQLPSSLEAMGEQSLLSCCQQLQRRRAARCSENKFLEAQVVYRCQGVARESWPHLLNSV